MPAKPLSEEQKLDAVRLRELMRQRKDVDPSLTQENIAFSCGMSQGAVYQYANGKIPLNLSAVLKFARLLKVEPRQISPTLAEELAGLPLAPASRGTVDTTMQRLAELVVLFGKADENGQLAILAKARAIAHPADSAGTDLARSHDLQRASPT